MGTYRLRVAGVAWLSACMVLSSCQATTTDHTAARVRSTTPPIIDASQLTSSSDEQSIPPDPAGILRTDWPTVSGSRLAAISKAAFNVDDGQHNQVTVTHLGAEGSALGLGDSITAQAQEISRAFDTAEFTVNYVKRRMTSIAAQANPADRGKIIDLATGLSSDLKQLGSDAIRGGSPAN